MKRFTDFILKNRAAQFWLNINIEPILRYLKRAKQIIKHS